MMALKNTVFFLLLILSVATSIRDAPIADDKLPTLNHEKVDEEGNSNDCWTCLSEVRSCSNEIIGFFLNGQTDIDTPCCRAIEVIMDQCWPAMVTVLGVSADQGKLLAGYCAKSSAQP